MTGASREERSTPSAAQAAYEELASYTLTHDGAEFIHQHVVDAFTAQSATPATKPIALTFALIGLYLHVERGLTGRQVQCAHMMLARRRRDWPALALPEFRGSMTALDVIGAPAGAERDRVIDAWCAAVWEAYRESAPIAARLAHEHGLDAWAAR